MTAPPDSALENRRLGLDPALARAVAESIDAGAAEDAVSRVLTLTPTDAARLIETLDGPARHALVEAARGRLDPEILSELDEDVRDEVVDLLGPARTGRALGELDTDDAVEVIQGLDEDVQEEVLESVPAAARADLEESLSYPEDSAGRLMQHDFVAVRAAQTVGETIDYLRAAPDLPDEFYDLFVLDAEQRPVNTVALSRLVRARRPVRIDAIVEPKAEFVTVPAETDQEEVAHLFRRRDLVSAPVVDAAGRMIGVITVDDVVEVIEEEREEDIMRLGGVSETDLNRSVIETMRARFAWLFVNLLTAVLASIVIGLFEASIEKIVALAVLMPICASMGGNAGTQSLTVVVRGLAMGQISTLNAVRILAKETLVGSVNGALFALIAGTAVGLWFQDWGLGFVLGAAMITNLIAAGLAGTLIPLGFHFLKIDPAISSVVFLTTVTDVVGFFAFLGLASWILL